MKNRSGRTVIDAAAEWVSEFDAIQSSMIEALIEIEPDSWSELTTPSYGDRVCVLDGEHDGEYGTIVEDNYDGESDLHCIEFDNKELGDAILSEDEFEVERDGFLPMWGWLWSFSDSTDNYWLEELDGIRLMSQCGLRIYEHDEWGYFFGIDGCGYSFMQEHWEPLYRARGLQWHDEEAEYERQMIKNRYKKVELGKDQFWIDEDDNVVEKVCVKS